MSNHFNKKLHATYYSNIIHKLYAHDSFGADFHFIHWYYSMYFSCVSITDTYLIVGQWHYDDKIELLTIGTPGQLETVNCKDIHICEADVSSSEQACNLGIIFDKEVNSKAQINNISKAGYYHVRNLAAIRNTLDLDSAKMATHAFVTSTLDYSNSLLYGLPYTKLRKLQVVQTASARVLIQAQKYDSISITAVRKTLH